MGNAGILAQFQLRQGKPGVIRVGVDNTINACIARRKRRLAGKQLDRQFVGIALLKKRLVRTHGLKRRGLDQAVEIFRRQRVDRHRRFEDNRVTHNGLETVSNEIGRILLCQHDTPGTRVNG